MSVNYVHGYTERESSRLKDQADCLNELLHHDTLFPAGSTILEAGCGVGAQTRIVAPKNRDSQFISVDISEDSLHQAHELIDSLGISNVKFLQEDIFKLPFPDGYFDHIFLCFVLEHLPSPLTALQALSRVLKKEGTITIIEGDHGSAFFYPHSESARKVIEAQIELQSRGGGNALIGRELYPLMQKSGFINCDVTPRMVYVDGSKPALVEGFIKNTFTAMLEGIRDEAAKTSIVDAKTFEEGIQGLYRTAKPDGVFCYTFFKGTGLKTE